MSRIRHVPRRILSMCLALSLWATALTPIVSASPTSNTSSQFETPPGASISVPVQVPPSMQTDTFANPRSLMLPPNFSISVHARIPDARFMAFAPNGDLFVSEPTLGKVEVVRNNPDGDPLLFDYVTGLREPQGIAFDFIAGRAYVYILETNELDRYTYTFGDTAAHDSLVIVRDLPDSSTPIFNGTYAHELKNLFIDFQHRIYIGVNTSCDACLTDTTTNPPGAAIYRYNADGSGFEVFATGLRNVEGLAMLPWTNELWGTVNGRNNILYPHQDATGNFGKLVPSYADNHPPEGLVHFREGGNYGWPYCNPTPDSPSGFNDMPYDQDVQNNADGHIDCSTMDHMNKGIDAHSTPLGMAFLQQTNFALPYRNGAAVARHGSFNRTVPDGYDVLFFPWHYFSSIPGDPIELVTGWLDSTTQKAWGRPVDVTVDRFGNMFISDDLSGTIYELSYHVTR